MARDLRELLPIMIWRHRVTANQGQSQSTSKILSSSHFMEVRLRRRDLHDVQDAAVRTLSRVLANSSSCLMYATIMRPARQMVTLCSIRPCTGVKLEA